MDGGPRGSRTRWWTPWAWTIALVVLCNAAITVEWAYPYCNDPFDGPAYAGFGFPLPYMQFGGVSSLEYDVMVAVYALNCLLLGAIIFPVLRSVVRRLDSHARVARAIALTGAVACALAVVVQVAVALLGWVPVRNIASAQYASYWEYRPVGVSSVHYDCAPSERWFGRARVRR